MECDVHIIHSVEKDATSILLELFRQLLLLRECLICHKVLLDSWKEWQLANLFILEHEVSYFLSLDCCYSQNFWIVSKVYYYRNFGGRFFIAEFSSKSFWLYFKKLVFSEILLKVIGQLLLVVIYTV